MDNRNALIVNAELLETNGRAERIAKCFGWMKAIAQPRRLKHRGLMKAGWIFEFAAAACNLARIRSLIAIAAAT